MEFGQTPKQLFTKPHPARVSAPPQAPAAQNLVAAVGRSDSPTPGASQPQQALTDSPPRPSPVDVGESQGGNKEDEFSAAQSNLMNDSQILPLDATSNFVVVFKLIFFFFFFLFLVARICVVNSGLGSTLFQLHS